MSDISIIIPARNAAATIVQAIESVLVASEVGQVIIVNDGSTDETVAEVSKISDPRIQIERGPCQGISAALNCGFSRATGQYIARCDADDFYPRERLGWQRSWLENHLEFSAISGAFTTVTASGKHVVDLAKDGARGDVTELLLAGNPITSFGTWLTRTSALREVGGARTWFKTAEDLDLQFRLATTGSVWHEPKDTYFYRLHDASITHTQATKEREFFDKTARDFAKQRIQFGCDDLEKGMPPKIGLNIGRDDKTATPARKQIADQLTGAAWKEFKIGNGKSALAIMVRAVSQQPYSLSSWKNMTALTKKLLQRKF